MQRPVNCPRKALFWALSLAAFALAPATWTEARPAQEPEAETEAGSNVEPAAAEPDAVEPDAVEPATAEPATAEPTQVDADAPASPPTRPLALTLEDVRRLALASNLELEIAALGAEIARFGARGSWGAFDPLFALSGRYEDSEVQLSNDVVTGTNLLEEQRLIIDTSLSVPITTGGNFRAGYVSERAESNSQFVLAPELSTDALSLGFTQPLLRGAGTRAATSDQRALEFAARREEELLRQRRADLLLDVENAYWDLVAAGDQLAVREQSLALFTRQAEEESERLRVGVGTEVDLLQAETNVAVERERLLFAQTDVETRRDALKQLILRREPKDEGGDERERGGWDQFLSEWDAPIEPLTALPEPAEEAPPRSWQSSLADAYERRAEIVAQWREIDRQRARLDGARSDRLPGLNFNVDARSAAIDESRREAFQETTGFESPTYGVGLALELPIGNRTARYAERSARAELRSAQLELERIQRTLLAEVRTAVRDVEYRREAVVAARRSSELAQRQLESEEVRYREGLSTTFQLLQFQQDLATARSNERAALANHAKALAALLRAEGRIEEESSR